jgi:hypothetical protein
MWPEEKEACPSPTQATQSRSGNYQFLKTLHSNRSCGNLPTRLLSFQSVTIVEYGWSPTPSNQVVVRRAVAEHRIFDDFPDVIKPGDEVRIVRYGRDAIKKGRHPLQSSEVLFDKHVSSLFDLVGVHSQRPQCQDRGL